jgi:hypothetical protein
MKKNAHRPAILAAACCICLLAAAPSRAQEKFSTVEVRFPTVEGCGVKWPQPMLAGTAKISWSGACKNGLAEGPGKLVATNRTLGDWETWEDLRDGHRPYGRQAAIYKYRAGTQGYAATYVRSTARSGPTLMKDRTEVLEDELRGWDAISEDQCRAAPECNVIDQARRGLAKPATYADWKPADAAPTPDMAGELFPAWSK